MRHAGIVAGRLQTIVAAEGGVALGLVIAVGEVAIGGREPVGAVLARHAAELPKRLLQALGQGGVALPALNDTDMLPAREGEPEVVEHVLERPAGKGHREAVGMGEVGQRLATGRMLLPEDQLALGTLGRPPMGDVALQSAQQPVRVTAGMQPLQFFKQGRGANARRPLQDRHDLGAPHVLEGIDPGPVLSGEPLARQYAAPLLDAPCRALAEAGSCRRDRLA